MMLHPVTGENLGGTIVHAYRHGNREGTFWKLEPFTFAGGNLETVGNQIELSARHLEGGMVVNLHGRQYSVAVRFNTSRNELLHGTCNWKNSARLVRSNEITYWPFVIN